MNIGDLLAEVHNFQTASTFLVSQGRRGKCKESFALTVLGAAARHLHMGGRARGGEVKGCRARKQWTRLQPWAKRERSAQGRKQQEEERPPRPVRWETRLPAPEILRPEPRTSAQP